MILVVDAGNTRIKWGVVGGGRWIAEGALAHADVAALREIACAHPALCDVFGSNVAGDAIGDGIAAALAGAAPAPRWLRPSAECCGVHNGYDEPAQLGADRWAALIGARALHPGACVVVCAGTATTVDILDAAGEFRGGLILPGEDLMRRALARDTARLPFADGKFVQAPRNTADAIRSGCRNAQLGAIERMFRQISAEPGARCVLSGGAAAPLEADLAIPYSRVDNLVLKGLAVAASGTGGRCAPADDRTNRIRIDKEDRK